MVVGSVFKFIKAHFLINKASDYYFVKYLISKFHVFLSKFQWKYKIYNDDNLEENTGDIYLSKLKAVTYQ